MQERLPGVALAIAWEYLSQFQKASFKQQTQDYLRRIHTIKSPYPQRRSYIVPDSDPIEHRGILPLEENLMFGSNDDEDTSFMHNDLNISNIIVDNDKIVGVIDWEMAGYIGWKTAGQVHVQIRTPKRENFSNCDLSEALLSDILFWNDLYDVAQLKAEDSYNGESRQEEQEEDRERRIALQDSEETGQDHKVVQLSYDPLGTEQIRLLGLQPAQDKSAALIANLIVRKQHGIDKSTEGAPTMPTFSNSEERDLSVDAPDIQTSASLDNGQADKDTRPAHPADRTIEAESYEALSYVWGGKPDPARCIKILQHEQESSISITANLESALRHLRRSHEVLYLWVDAICINQEDKVEKGAQIMKMAEIYNQATNVRVWLGEEKDDSGLGLEFIRRVVNHGNLEQLMHDEPTPGEWNAFLGLVRRPWFSRRWVLQEISLARDAHLHCGEGRVTWREFAEAVSLFTSRQPGVRELFQGSKSFDRSDFRGEIEESGADRLVSTSSNFFRKSDDGTIMESLLSLEALMSSLTEFQASDPHDILYAILSLSNDAPPFIDRPRIPLLHEPLVVNTAEDGQRKRKRADSAISQLPPQLRSHLEQAVDGRIIVDYGKTVFEVCKDFLAFAMAQSQSLDMICRPWAPSPDLTKEPDLPSWIPKLSGAPFERVDQVCKRLEADPLVGTPGVGGKVYNASGKGKAIWQFKQGISRSLFVRGFELDKVGAKSETGLHGHIPAEWLTLVNWDYLTAPAPERFWRTLVADRGPDGRRPPCTYRTALNYAFQHQGKYGDLNIGDIILSGKYPSTAIDFLKRVRAVIWRRSLILTQRENFLGLAPSKAREGDLVCILYGCSVPVVLRRMERSSLDIASQTSSRRKRSNGRNPLRTGSGDNEPYYEFIGECYIDGMMDGEALLHQRVNGLEQQDFELG